MTKRIAGGLIAGFLAFVAVSGCNKTSFKATPDWAQRGNSTGTTTSTTAGDPAWPTQSVTPASNSSGLATGGTSSTTPTPIARPPILARNVTGFVFSGDGPGSCGGVAGCLPTAQPCPAGFDASPGIQGDCFECAKFPGKCAGWNYKHLCNGNRLICRQSGAATTGMATIDLHFFYDRCDPGFVPAGPASNRFHVLTTNVLDRGNTVLRELHLCKRTRAVEQLQTGDAIVTDLQFFTPGSRRTDIAACPASDPAGSFTWSEAGVFPDCVRANNPTAANSGICTGLLTACKKYERVP